MHADAEPYHYATIESKVSTKTSNSISPYTHHLLLLSQEQTVTLREDITSRNYRVLFKRGTPLDGHVVKTLSREANLKPLEQLIVIEDELNADALYQVLEQFIACDVCFTELYQQRDLNDKFLQCIESFCEFELLRQKLTVLATRMPEVFDQSLFCAWLAITILSNENYPQNALNSMFIAALSHDLGLLSIPPEYFQESKGENPQHWQKIQQHTTYSAELLRGIHGVDADCIRAVMEHHETIDGTGYPKGKIKSQLNEYGQMLHILDNIYITYCKHFKIRGRTLHDLVPIIQMTTFSMTDHFSKILIGLFNKTSTTQHHCIADTLVSSAIKLIKSNAGEIQSFLDITEDFIRQIGSEHKDIRLLILQKMSSLIKTITANCGIVNSAYLRWLDQVEKEQLKFAYRELEDVLLMTQEIQGHISNYKKRLVIYLSTHEKTPNTAMVIALKLALDAINHEEPDIELQSYLRGGDLPRHFVAQI